MGIYIDGVSMPKTCMDCVCLDDEYWYCKAKGRTLEEQLKTWTVICCFLFAIVSIVLYLSIAKAW